MTELLTRTVCVKLDALGHDAALEATQRRFNEAATWVAAVCWDERITNTNTAHHRVYGETRAIFGLGAQLAVRAREGGGGHQGHLGGRAEPLREMEGDQRAQEAGQEEALAPTGSGPLPRL